MTLPRWPRVAAAAALGVGTATLIELASSPIAAATTAGSDGSGASPALLLAALGGGCLAAVWLLRPTGRSGTRDGQARRSKAETHEPRSGDDRSA